MIFINTSVYYLQQTKLPRVSRKCAWVPLVRTVHLMCQTQLHTHWVTKETVSFLTLRTLYRNAHKPEYQRQKRMKWNKERIICLVANKRFVAIHLLLIMIFEFICNMLVSIISYILVVLFSNGRYSSHIQRWFHRYKITNTVNFIINHIHSIFLNSNLPNNCYDYADIDSNTFKNQNR